MKTIFKQGIRPVLLVMALLLSVQANSQGCPKQPMVSTDEPSQGLLDCLGQSMVKTSAMIRSTLAASDAVSGSLLLLEIDALATQCIRNQQI